MVSQTRFSRDRTAAYTGREKGKYPAHTTSMRTRCYSLPRDTDATLEFNKDDTIVFNVHCLFVLFIVSMSLFRRSILVSLYLFKSRLQYFIHVASSTSATVS